MKDRGRAGTRRPRRRPRIEQRFPEEIHRAAAGIDIASKSYWVAVPEDRDEHPAREFRRSTEDLRALADWLAACGIQTVAMEPIGDHWLPLYAILEQRRFEVVLVEARSFKGVPGRPRDLLDCQWIQRLHTCGLLPEIPRRELSAAAYQR